MRKRFTDTRHQDEHSGTVEGQCSDCFGDTNSFLNCSESNILVPFLTMLERKGLTSKHVCLPFEALLDQLIHQLKDGRNIHGRKKEFSTDSEKCRQRVLRNYKTA